MAVLALAVIFGSNYYYQFSSDSALLRHASASTAWIQWPGSGMNEIAALVAQLQQQSQQVKAAFLQRLMSELEDENNDDDDNDNSDSDEPSRYYMHHFQDHFRLTPINRIEISAEVAESYKNYQLISDPYYLENKAECDFLDQEFSPYLNGTGGGMHDERFFVKWSEENEHYSLYAKVDMATKVVLGSFAGVLRYRPQNIDDSWKYRGNVIGDDGNPLDLVIDSRFKGNWFHFLRTTEKKGNVEAVLVPYIRQNMWHVVFQAKRSIVAGEELLIGDGDLD